MAISRFKRIRMFALITLLAQVLLYPSYYIYALIKAYNYEFDVPGDIIDYGRQIDFKLNFTEIDQLTPHCSRNCRYYNSALIKLEDDRIIIAARESTRQQCQGLWGFLVSVVYLLRPAISSIVHGELDLEEDGGGEMVVRARINGRIMDLYTPHPMAYHQGMEDPRWISHLNELYILSSAEIGIPRMFLTRMKDNGIGVPLSSLKTIALQPTFGSSDAQKNWMYLPDDEPGLMSFVHTISPLTIVQANLTNGQTNITFMQHHVPSNQSLLSGKNLQDLKLSGSTGFLKIKDSLFIAMAHSKKKYYEISNLDVKFYLYESYFILLENRPKDSSKWQIRRISEPFTLPITPNSHKCHRIHFACSMIQHRDEFLVSFGYMDCTSHLIKFKKSTVFKKLGLL